MTIKRYMMSDDGTTYEVIPMIDHLAAVEQAVKEATEKLRKDLENGEQAYIAMRKHAAVAGEEVEKLSAENSKLREALAKQSVFKWIVAGTFQCRLCDAGGDTFDTVEHSPTCLLYNGGESK